MNKIVSEKTEEEHKARKTIMEVAYLILFVFLLLIMILTWASSLTSTAQLIAFAVQGFIALAALTSFIFSRAFSESESVDPDAILRSVTGHLPPVVIAAKPLAVPGTYQFVNLVPGQYKIEIEKTGFRRILREPVRAFRRRASPADAFYPEASLPPGHNRNIPELPSSKKAPGRAGSLP